MSNSPRRASSPHIHEQPQPSPPSLPESFYPLKRSHDLEGQRKIIDYFFLEPSLAKGVLIGLPLVLSLVGLYFLLKSTALRAKVFYSRHRTFIPGVASSILVVAEDQSSEIVSIRKKVYNQEQYHVFRSQLLEYVIMDDTVYPLASSENDKISNIIHTQNLNECGVSSEEFIDRLTFFGSNQHRVEIPSYFSYLLKILTEPLFMLQYLMFWIWLVQKLYWTTIGNLSFCVAVISINYGILYYNHRQIKKMAEKQFKVKTIRNGQVTEISNLDIVPGDVLEIGKEIPCDCVVVRGDVLVNQANFTGQNLPILKTKLEHIGQVENSGHWIYEGSEVLQVREGTFVVAVHTGFTSHRGRIIRKIVKHSVKEPLFTHKILIFFVLAYLSAILIYLAYLSKLMSIAIQQPMVVFLLFEIISLAVPIGYIGVVNFFPGLSLIKLGREGIIGQQPYKVYESAQIKTICFDKTGTLTSNQVQLIDIYGCQDKYVENITKEFGGCEIVRQLFGCCHMIRHSAGGELMGDEIDLKMFGKSKGVILESDRKDALWAIQIEGELYDVLRVNQFESRYKSMSVLVRNRKNNQLIVFGKGSPELMHSLSREKCRDAPRLVKNLSLEGYRVIGFGYKVIRLDELDTYMKAPREMFLEDMQMLGLASFGNGLKEETARTIQRLRDEMGLAVKMITGDNIFTAVKTAYLAGIVTHEETVAVCQGQLGNLTVTSVTFSSKHFEEKEQHVYDLGKYISEAPSDIVFALQDSLLQPEIFHPELIDKIRVFARVSPQNKTLIVSKLQQGLQKQYEERTGMVRFFGDVKRCVCMVGDGANDLMAIKQSDVGIGLSESDSTASADFSVTKLDQIEAIVRQGKSISSIVVQSLVILFINTWLYIPLTLLAMVNLCTVSDATMLYKNIAFTIPLPLLLGLCRPSTHNTKEIPQVNILAPKHQAIIWANNFIFTLAFVYCFEIYWNSSQFQINARGWVSMSNGFTTHSRSSTLCFLLTVVHCQVINFVIYQKDPFKKAMTSNIPLTVWMVLNFLSLYLAYFRPATLGFMKLEWLSTKLASRVLVVMAGAFGVSWAATSLIYRFNEQSKSQPRSLKDIK